MLAGNPLVKPLGGRTARESHDAPPGLLNRLGNRINQPKTSRRSYFFGTWFHDNVGIHYSMCGWFKSIPRKTCLVTYWLTRGLARDPQTDAIDDSSDLGTHPRRRNRHPRTVPAMGQGGFGSHRGIGQRRSSCCYQGTRPTRQAQPLPSQRPVPWPPTPFATRQNPRRSVPRLRTRTELVRRGGYRNGSMVCVPPKSSLVGRPAR